MRPPRGFRLRLDELDRLGVPRVPGTRFETDLFAVYRSVYEVLEVTEGGAVVAFVARVRPASQSGPMTRVELLEDAAPDTKRSAG